MSQQGKAYTPEQKAIIIESLKTYLQLGYSRNKACGLIGFDPTTLSKWVVEDAALSMKLEGWENFVNTASRQALVNSILGDKEKKVAPDLENAKWWLERKNKKEFGRNMDVTSDGEGLNITGVTYRVIDGGVTEETENGN